MKESACAANPDTCVAALSGRQRSCVEHLRAAVRSGTALGEAIKWEHLVYLSNGPVLLIRAQGERVLFGFWRAKRLRHLDARIKPGGKNEMATIKLRSHDTVDTAVASRLTQEAVALNTTPGDPTKLS